jgi:hypothetical protein
MKRDQNLFDQSRHHWISDLPSSEDKNVWPGPLRGLCLWGGRGGEVRFTAWIISIHLILRRPRGAIMVGVEQKSLKIWILRPSEIAFLESLQDFNVLLLPNNGDKLNNYWSMWQCYLQQAFYEQVIASLLWGWERGGGYGSRFTTKKKSVSRFTCLKKAISRKTRF